MEYVERIDSLLESLLSRESLNDGEIQCKHCRKGACAVWRCKDCSLGTSMCRACMRTSHRHNPFHRIERWTGKFYRPAELWEVGAYLLVQHHVGTQLCENLNCQLDFLEKVETGKDSEEQEKLRNVTLGPAQEQAPLPVPTPADLPTYQQKDTEPASVDNGESDEVFQKYLNDLLKKGPDIDDPLEVEDGVEEEENDCPPIHPYLQMNSGDENPSLFPFTGTYIRVVHSNGIHNIAMINCDCRGYDMVAGDLLASRLLPASFQRIRTLFTVQLLDLFRLSNLELKTSAYHFYHLLRRITSPMDPAGVVDLYREFRRMSRLWRWMKRLKWAGYPCNNTPVKEVKDGELAVFCAACPQPGINIPDNWKQDKARYVLYSLSKVTSIDYFKRWKYKRGFTGDGNFKADHVRQNNEVGDEWLSEGGGMIPKRQDYMAFLKTAIERLTVCLIHISAGLVTEVQINCRKRPVKTLSGPL